MIVDNDEHPLKDESPIDVIESSNVTVVNDVAPLNEFDPTFIVVLISIILLQVN